MLTQVRLLNVRFIVKNNERFIPSMGVDHEGYGEQVPQNLECGGRYCKLYPLPRFCYIDTKMSVLWLSK